MFSFFSPQALFGLQSLHILGLSDNELTILPSAVSNLVNLREVDISKNGELRDSFVLTFLSQSENFQQPQSKRMIINQIFTIHPTLCFTKLEADLILVGIIDLPESVKSCKCLEQFDASVNPIGK